ncbi:ASPIC/UnbV domain-containing protein [Flammeovirgaceae bacterium 311]|nr:ASPIC/UnbV domain-containing protein [Flammeovirgaceae bacterium 311]
MQQSNIRLLIFSLLTSVVLLACQPQGSKEEMVAAAALEEAAAAETLFSVLPPERTGVTFVNLVKETPKGNIMAYQYFYNGGGVAVGDIDGDGFEDLYFSGNMVPNRLYLNRGSKGTAPLQFEDITTQAGVGGRDGNWKTGVSLADVNGDGLLDIYVCYSGHMPAQARINQLFINQGPDENGIPVFQEQAKEYGLDDAAYSTHATFFDFDRDGDLDMFLLNHNPFLYKSLDDVSINEKLKQTEPMMRVKLYRNDKGAGGTPRFTDVTEKAGFEGSGFTYSLGAGVADINGDGWPDIYVSNDYSAPDYLYINNKNGTFSDKLQTSMGHIPIYSMGNSVSDINNDGLPDIYVLDMLPEDNRRQKLLFSPDNYEQFELYQRVGFHNQYMRNMLQLNTGVDENGAPVFSEIGQLSGISNTDWSWAPLFADYDNDGWKDLFVSNGFMKDFTNLDFIKYSKNFFQTSPRGPGMAENLMALLAKMPSSNVNNYIYRNEGGQTFSNQGKAWGMDVPSNSNGAVYADLDGDGDLDLVVNNINKPAFIYENRADKQLSHHFLQLKLEGAGANTAGIGTKVMLYARGKQQHQEQMPNRGYQSSVSPLLHFGLGTEAAIDSLRIIWPTGKTQLLEAVAANQLLVVEEKNATATYRYPKAPAAALHEVSSPIAFAHASSNINDFKRQPLLVNPLSFSGPCMVKADVDADGLEDVLIGGAAGQAAKLFLQQKNGSFKESAVAAFADDSASEDTDALFFDANADGRPDLYIASGGYGNFMPEDALLQDRLYLGDGRGGFVKAPDALPLMRTSSAVVRAADLNGDGREDLFVGGRVIPGRYPEAPRSYVLLSDGTGTGVKFTDKTAEVAPQLLQPGMVTDAAFHDLNGDGTKELVVVGEWMPLMVFSSKEGKLIDATGSYFEKSYTGWWNKLLVSDFNGDGRADLLIGNMGENSQVKVREGQPAELYYKDFDENGSVDPILNFYIKGTSYPYVTRDELLDQISMLRTRFSSYESYADATMSSIFSQQELKDVDRLSANYLKTAYFEGTGGKFKEKELPLEVQYSPVYAMSVVDYNGDGIQDVVLGGNINGARLRFGKYDASYGMLLQGNGRGGFGYVPQRESGLKLKGDIRSILSINNTLLFGINQQSIKAYKLKQKSQVL